MKRRASKKRFVPPVRARVLVWLSNEAHMLSLMTITRARDWELLDLSLTRGAIPEDKRPIGALVDRLPSDSVVKSLRRMHCPVVRIGYLPHPNDHMVPAVLPDLTTAGRLAADYLARRGFQNLAKITSGSVSMQRPLHAGFEERCMELGLSQHSFHIEGGMQADTVAQRIKRFGLRTKRFADWMQGLPKPLGILTGSDFRAARICIMSTASGYRVPEHVAILGVGNHVRTCEMAPVALSSIDLAVNQCVNEAVMVLDRLIKGESPPDHPIFVPPSKIVSRRSTEVLALDNADVVRALRFIWDHYRENISVYDVARNIGVSRRTLERAFHAHHIRGINDEIGYKRLEACCELLKTTNKTVRDIVPLCGFRSADYLHQVFRNAFDMTPRQWRLAQNHRHADHGN